MGGRKREMRLGCWRKEEEDGGRGCLRVLGEKK